MVTVLGAAGDGEGDDAGLPESSAGESAGEEGVEGDGEPGTVGDGDTGDDGDEDAGEGEELGLELEPRDGEGEADGAWARAEGLGDGAPTTSPLSWLDCLGEVADVTAYVTATATPTSTRAAAAE